MSGKTVIKTDNFDIAKIADSGQCFRMNADAADPTRYTATAADKQITLREIGEDIIEFGCDESEYNAFWRDYFDLGIQIMITFTLYTPPKSVTI